MREEAIRSFLCEFLPNYAKRGRSHSAPNNLVNRPLLAAVAAGEPALPPTPDQLLASYEPDDAAHGLLVDLAAKSDVEAISVYRRTRDFFAWDWTSAVHRAIRLEEQKAEAVNWQGLESIQREIRQDATRGLVHLSRLEWAWREYENRRRRASAEQMARDLINLAGTGMNQTSNLLWAVAAAIGAFTTAAVTSAAVRPTGEEPLWAFGAMILSSLAGLLYRLIPEFLVPTIDEPDDALSFLEDAYLRRRRVRAYQRISVGLQAAILSVGIVAAVRILLELTSLQ